MKGLEAIRQDIKRLQAARTRINAHAASEGRALTNEESRVAQDISECIQSLELELPANGGAITMRVGVIGDPTIQRASIVRPSLAPGRDYRSMFGHASGIQLDRGGFRDCAEFLQVLDSGRFDPRLQARASMGETTPSLGGFSVPPDFASEWLDASLPNEIVRNLCRVYPMQSETREIPGWDGSDMSSGATHGGLVMEFLSEGETASPQTAKLRKVTLTARMAGIYTDASIELVQDGKGFADNLQLALQQSIGYGIDRYSITGSGVGCPQGILHAPCKIQVTPEAGQRADTIVYQNLKRMFSRQLNPDRAVWLFNSTSIPDLLEQSVAVGTGGNFVPLLNESNGKFSIFGRPVYFHPSMPSIGDADDCAFVDFAFYSIGMRSDVSIDITDAHKWLQRERSYRVLLRFDGMTTLATAITPENGLTLSPVVSLAERA